MITTLRMASYKSRRPLGSNCFVGLIVDRGPLGRCAVVRTLHDKSEERLLAVYPGRSARREQDTRYRQKVIELTTQLVVKEMQRTQSVQLAQRRRY